MTALCVEKIITQLHCTTSLDFKSASTDLSINGQHPPKNKSKPLQTPPRCDKRHHVATHEETCFAPGRPPNLTCLASNNLPTPLSTNEKLASSLDLVLRSMWIKIVSWEKYQEYGSIMTDIGPDSIPKQVGLVLGLCAG
jgi:hypothetical protein